MVKLSANRLKTFIDCKNKYVLKYILGVQEPKNIYAIRGTAVHKAIEMFHKHAANPFKTYEETWHKEMKDANVEHSNKLFYEGEDMLELYDWADRIPTEIEKYFCLPFPDAQDPIALVEGYIDQLYLNENMSGYIRGVVIDIKTAKKKPTKEQLANDIQFIIYNWAFEQLYNMQTHVFWYHARTKEYIEAFVQGDAQLQLVIDAITVYKSFLETADLELREKTCQYCIAPNKCLGISNTIAAIRSYRA